MSSMAFANCPTSSGRSCADDRGIELTLAHCIGILGDGENRGQQTGSHEEIDEQKQQREYYGDHHDDEQALAAGNTLDIGRGNSDDTSSDYFAEAIICSPPPCRR